MSMRELLDYESDEEGRGEDCGSPIYYTSFINDPDLCARDENKPIRDAIESATAKIENHELVGRGLYFKQVISEYKDKSKRGRNNSHPAIYSARVNDSARFLLCIYQQNGEPHLLSIKFFLSHKEYITTINRWKRNPKLVVNAMDAERRTIEAHFKNLREANENQLKTTNFLPKCISTKTPIQIAERSFIPNELQKKILIESNENIKEIIKNTTKDAKKNSNNHILIKGPAGSGKTTAAMLLCAHFYHYANFMKHNKGKDIKIMYLFPLKLLKNTKQMELDRFLASQGIPPDCVIHKTTKEQQDIDYLETLAKCDLVLMSTLPQNNINKAQADKIYLSQDGRCIVFDPSGNPKVYQLDQNKIDLADLSDQVKEADKKNQLKNAILMIIKESKFFAKRKDCITWIKNRIENQNIIGSLNLDHKDNKILKMIYAEFCIISACDDKEEYMQKKSLFDDAKIKNWLWKSYPVYKKLNVRDLTPLKYQEDTCYIVEEAHIISPAIIKGLCAQEISHFITDSNQITKFGMNNQDYIKTCLVMRTHKEPFTIEFPFSYRVPLQVMGLLHRLQQLLKEQTEIKSNIDHSNTGQVVWLASHEVPVLKKAMQEREASTRIAVLIADKQKSTSENKKSTSEDKKQKAISDYHTPLVCMAEESGGLEYEVVILDDLLDVGLLKEFNKKLRSNKDKNPVPQDEEKIKKESIVKNELKLFYRRLLIAITRTQKILVICLSAQAEKEIPFVIDFLKGPSLPNITIAQILDEIKPSKPEDWLKLVEQFILSGDKNQRITAEDIYIKKLGKTKDEFETLEKKLNSFPAKEKILATPHATLSDEKSDDKTNSPNNNANPSRNVSHHASRGRGRGRFNKRNQQKQNRPVNDRGQQTSVRVEASEPKADNQSKELFSAFESDQIEFFENLAKEGEDLNNIELSVRDSVGGSVDNMPLLHMAIEYNCPNIVKYLLSLPNMDVNKVAIDASIPLMRAVKRKNKEILQSLLNRSDLNINKKYDPPINFSSKTSFNYALERVSADPDSQDVVDRLSKHQRLEISDEDFKFFVARENLLSESTSFQINKKYIVMNQEKFSNNFNEDFIINLFERKEYVLILFCVFEGEEKNAPFQYIAKDPKRLDFFIQCIMKKREKCERYMIRLLKACYKAMSEGSDIKDYIGICINSTLLANLNVDQLFILFDDLNDKNNQGVFNEKEIDWMIDKITTQPIMPEFDCIEWVRRCIKSGLFHATECLLREQSLKGHSIKINDKTMLSFINCAIENDQLTILELLLNREKEKLNLVQLKQFVSKALSYMYFTMVDVLIVFIEQQFAKKVAYAIEIEVKKIKEEYATFKNAIKENDIQLVKKCIQEDTVVLNYKIDGSLPLHTAIRNQNLELIKTLLTSDKIEIDLVDKTENRLINALLLARETKNEEIISLLIQDERVTINIATIESMMLVSETASFRAHLQERYKHEFLESVRQNNFDKTMIFNLLRNEQSLLELILFESDLLDFVKNWFVFTQCLMTKHDGSINQKNIQNGMRYIWRIFTVFQVEGVAQEKKESYLKKLEIILSKMTLERSFLLLGEAYENGNKWVAPLIAAHSEMKNMSVVDRIKIAIELNYPKVAMLYLQENNTHLDDKEISSFLVQAVEKAYVDIIYSLLNIITLDQFLKINFKSVVEKAKALPEIAKQLNRASYFAGLLNRFKNVNVVNLLASKEVVSFFFDKDVLPNALNGNLITTIMENPEWSEIFIKCLFAPHGSVVDQNKAIININETFIKKGQVYIERFDRAALFKLVGILCAKNDAGKLSQVEAEAMSKILNDERIRKMSDAEKTSLAVELNLGHRVEIFLQENIKVFSKAIEKI